MLKGPIISKAQRPVLIVGAGVRITKQEKEIVDFANYFKLPMLLTWGARDLLAHDHPLNMGGLGACGPRAGNFAAQNSDLVIAIGTRLSQLITGGKQNLFAPNSKKIMVDIDGEELRKFDKETFTLDLSIQADLKSFFTACQSKYQKQILDQYVTWRHQISDWKEKYPVCNPTYFSQTEKVKSE